MPATETSVLTNLHDVFAIEDARNRSERLDAERRAAAESERRAAELAERRRHIARDEARERDAREAAARDATEARLAAERAVREHESRLETERLVAVERVRAEASRVSGAAEAEARDELVRELRRMRRSVLGLSFAFALGALGAGFGFSGFEGRMRARANAQELALVRERSEVIAARAARDASREENRTLRERIAALEGEARGGTVPVAGGQRGRPVREEGGGAERPGFVIRRCAGPLGCL